MRAQFFLIPAAVVACAPAQAKVFMSVDQAQRAMFPHGSFRELPVPARTGAFERSWKVSTGGWFIVDQVEGKGDLITYAVALDADGTVQGLEILECAADYDTITMPRWRHHFLGRQAWDALRDIKMISGSTLSSRHITEGVRRILSTRRPA